MNVSLDKWTHPHADLHKELSFMKRNKLISVKTLIPKPLRSLYAALKDVVWKSQLLTQTKYTRLPPHHQTVLV